MNLLSERPVFPVMRHFRFCSYHRDTRRVNVLNYNRSESADLLRGRQRRLRIRAARYLCRSLMRRRVLRIHLNSDSSYEYIKVT